jgi:glycosyltransferase involved in cell wall biosynthesis
MRDGCELLIRDNPESFADGCLTLMKDTGFCHRLGSAAREKVAELYERKRIINLIQSNLRIDHDDAELSEREESSLES